jgi:uncharacterized Ntn-hydrolase superfamily protein
MTYSIVARCPDTGMLGMAIATCLPCVGRIARYLEPGVGVVASQARLLPAHGTRVLDGLRNGLAPEDALAASLALDEDAAHRQVGVVAADGRVVAHTGDRCIPYAGHVTGEGWSAQANMMTAPGVPEAMAAAFEASAGEHLARRLLAALDAAEALGGDIRGRQSAAVHVKRAEAVGDVLVDVVVDARVDDDPEPLVPLRRVVELALGYDEADAADEAVEAGDLAEAARRHRESLRLSPHDPQVAFWHALTLAGAGHTDAARAAWAEVTARGGPGHWAELVDRMVRDDLLPVAAAEAIPRHGC